MKITKIELGEVNIPLVTPFKTALRTVESVNDVVVRILTDEGLVGYGEAPATVVITGDTKGSIACAIESFIAPTLIGRQVEDLDGNMERLQHCILKNTSAKAAIDMALYDLWAKACHKPLYQVLGGHQKRIETDLTISVNPIEEMVKDSIEAVDRGFHILKVKVGKEGRKDVERIKAIREAIGEDIQIRVDANQGWSAKEAVKIIGQMEEAGLDIDLVEQPVKAHDLRGMQYVTQHTQTAILADESVFGVEDAIRLIQMGACDLLNIKLMKTGGIYEALKICAVAEAFEVNCMMGCMLESKIAVSAAAHLAAAKGIITKVDLDGPALCKVDPYEGGPIFCESQIVMSETPGLGITYVPGFKD